MSNRTPQTDDSIVRRALAYPYDRPKHDFALVEGKPQRLVSFNEDRIGESIVMDVAGNKRSLLECAPALKNEEGWTATIASGSNAAVEQLKRKFKAALDGQAIVVLDGVLDDFVSVYSAHFAGYGAVPATLWPLIGARARLACVILPNALLPLMHETESLGVSYGFFELPGARYSWLGGSMNRALYAYLSLNGALTMDGQPVRLAAIEAQNAGQLPCKSVEEMLEFVRCRSRGFSTVPDLVHAIVEDAERRQQVMAEMHDFVRALPLEQFPRVA